MYSVYAGSNLIGHTALENGDAPMGFAFGGFLLSDGYARIRKVYQRRVPKTLERWWFYRIYNRKIKIRHPLRMKFMLILIKDSYA